jgi:hypothetical protein
MLYPPPTESNPQIMMDSVKYSNLIIEKLIQFYPLLFSGHDPLSAVVATSAPPLSTSPPPAAASPGPLAPTPRPPTSIPPNPPSGTGSSPTSRDALPPMPPKAASPAQTTEQLLLDLATGPLPPGMTPPKKPPPAVPKKTSGLFAPDSAARPAPVHFSSLDQLDHAATSGGEAPVVAWHPISPRKDKDTIDLDQEEAPLTPSRSGGPPQTPLPPPPATAPPTAAPAASAPAPAPAPAASANSSQVDALLGELESNLDSLMGQLGQ